MKRLFASFLLICLLLTACAVPEEATPSDCLVIHYIDVDQADCMLLIAGDTTIMIDGGNTGTSQDVLAYLRRFGVKQIDLMVNTHPHGDHLGGIPTVLNNIPTDEIWCADSTYDTYLYKNFTQLVQQKGFTISHPEPGTKFEENNVSVTVLGPLNAADTYSDLNDTSLVLMVEFEDTRFLFTGDMETLAEGDMLDFWGEEFNWKCDVLKVGHHGSYSSTGYRLLREVAPTWAVIPCGYQNDYGHPHESTLSRFRDAEVSIFRLDHSGTVIATTDGEKLAFAWESGGYTPYIPQ